MLADLIALLADLPDGVSQDSNAQRLASEISGGAGAQIGSRNDVCDTGAKGHAIHDMMAAKGVLRTI